MLFLLGTTGALLSAPTADWPGDWPQATPESQGLVTPRLEKLWDTLQKRRSTAFVVIRNDKLVFERYSQEFSRTKPHGTASLAKALVGGLSLMLAINDERIKPDDLASDYIPQWKRDALKSKITVRQLATHTSGLEDAEADQLPHNKLTGWKGDFWQRLPPPRDPFTLARDVTPVVDMPGTRARYSNPGMGMLSYCITKALRGSTNADLRSLLKYRILEPLGVPQNEWTVGYGKPTEIEGLSLVAPWGGASYSPNAAARIGRLLLHNGSWNGRQLIDRSVVEMATTWAGVPNHSGLGWWVNRNPDGTRFWKSLPEDAFYGAGAGHQFLLVVPSLSLIVVRNGEQLEPKASFDAGLEKHLVDPLMGCLEEKHHALHSPSPVIRQIQWEPKERIIRKAKGSDNWPLTWADDDALYTAYGDGNGFEPMIPTKLSLGFAKVLGTPPAYSGVNLRSATGEQLGDGRRGRKASGILMVDGVLYLWARNATNSQLAWSTDHATTWAWCDWRFTNSFGCPTFLSFGRNYQNARDNYVYVFSPDSETAYDIADRILLARVPKEQIRNRGAYEFFVNTDNSGTPHWSADISLRGPVLTNPARCYRTSVSYDSALRRYLLVMPLPERASGADSRFRGALAVYDAEEPWGPWTSAFLAEPWDVGPGDSASFPTKWMSADGKTLYLVFSGEDSFSVRKATLIAGP